MKEGTAACKPVRHLTFSASLRFNVTYCTLHSIVRWQQTKLTWNDNMCWEIPREVPIPANIEQEIVRWCRRCKLYAFTKYPSLAAAFDCLDPYSHLQGKIARSYLDSYRISIVGVASQGSWSRDAQYSDKLNPTTFEPNSLMILKPIESVINSTDFDMVDWLSQNRSRLATQKAQMLEAL